MIQIDMEMPEKCGLCPLFHAEHPMHCQGVKADRKKKIVAPYGQPRPDWCPLHEVTADPDTVSRQAVIECLEHLSACDESFVEIGTDDETFIGKYEAITEISDLPPSPTPSRPPWIPCRERLPEGKQEVLVTEYGDTDIGRRFRGRWLDRYGDKMKDVTAWMEKPEPYKEVT